MENLPVNVTDLAVLGIVLVSGLFAFIRGFVREIFSVTGWVGAGFATYFGFPYLRPYFDGVVDDKFFADAATGAVIFITSLVALSILSGAIARQIRESQLNALDRSLGFVFGVARGGLIICLAYLALAWALPPSEQPTWIREARVLPLVEFGANQLVGLLPENAQDRFAGGIAIPKLGADGAIDKKVVLEKLVNPPPPLAPEANPGYKEKERNALDQLIESVR